MSFIHSKPFKYLKNLLIGIGASVVLLGALAKLQSYDWQIFGLDLIDVGLWVEAFMFAMLGLLPPEKDYYWEKLYPGLDKYESKIAPITADQSADDQSPALNGEVVEQQLGGMLTELQSMSKSLGSLKALQEVDFSGTSEQLKTMSNFYTRMNEAMADLNDSLQDTKAFKDNLGVLNQNLGSLNGVYGNILNAFTMNRPQQ